MKLTNPETINEQRRISLEIQMCHPFAKPWLLIPSSQNDLLQNPIQGSLPPSPIPWNNYLPERKNKWSFPGSPHQWRAIISPETLPNPQRLHSALPVTTQEAFPYFLQNPNNLTPSTFAKILPSLQRACPVLWASQRPAHGRCSYFPGLLTGSVINHLDISMTLQNSMWLYSQLRRLTAVDVSHLCCFSFNLDVNVLTPSRSISPLCFKVSSHPSSLF